MRPILVLLACALGGATGCTADGNLRDGLFPPRLSAAEQADRDQRRGALEILVKTHTRAILDQIDSGGGPDLQQAYDLAGVPAADRPTRTLQLRSNLGFYEVNPGALVTALRVYGG